MQTKDVKINDYLADWLLKWQGNMDIKLVCNEFICNYITKYCTKPEPQGLLEVKENEITVPVTTLSIKIPLCESLIDKRYIKRPKECERIKNPEDRQLLSKIIDEFSMIDLQLFEYIMQIMHHQMFQIAKFYYSEILNSYRL
eukprot:NODE_120_length_17920_cov_0.559782.p13 type:complete len:142 gc:universal NODE_120_length_17920_cov_0.559782:12587-13012(+)